MPALIAPIMNEATNVPKMVPVPPKTDVPPRKTEASVLRSWPSATVGQKYDTSRLWIRPDRAANTADDHEGEYLDPVDVDAHQPGAILVVADRIDVRAEAMPVQEEPHDDGDDDRPDELHRDPIEEASDEQGVQAGALGRHQRLPVAAAHDEHHAAPEELCASVATSDGMPTLVMTTPLKSPAPNPMPMQRTAAIHTFPVRLKTIA